MAELLMYLIISAAIFTIGAYGIITQRSGIKILMCIELMLNSANINLVASQVSMTMPQARCSPCSR